MATGRVILEYSRYDMIVEGGSVIKSQPKDKSMVGKDLLKHRPVYSTVFSLRIEIPKLDQAQDNGNQHESCDETGTDTRETVASRRARRYRRLCRPYRREVFGPIGCVCFRPLRNDRSCGE